MQSGGGGDAGLLTDASKDFGAFATKLVAECLRHTVGAVVVVVLVATTRPVLERRYGVEQTRERQRAGAGA